MKTGNYNIFFIKFITLLKILQWGVKFFETNQDKDKESKNAPL